MKKIIILFGLFSFIYSHCQVPCGIYDDALRIVQIREHIVSIKKAMNQINVISSADQTAQDYNQLIRWVNTKENHAELIQGIISDYFLTQRIAIQDKTSPDWNQYTEMTLTLQQMLVSAMKCKQTVVLTHPENLEKLIQQFVDLYFDDHGKEHLRALSKDQ